MYQTAIRLLCLLNRVALPLGFACPPVCFGLRKILIIDELAFDLRENTNWLTRHMRNTRQQTARSWEHEQVGIKREHERVSNHVFSLALCFHHLNEFVRIVLHINRRV